jgi:hypothetical protein
MSRITFSRGGVSLSISEEIERRAREEELEEARAREVERQRAQRERDRQPDRLGPVARAALDAAFDNRDYKRLAPALQQCFGLVLPAPEGLDMFAYSVNYYFERCGSHRRGGTLDLFLELVWKALVDNFADEHGMPGRRPERLMGLSRGYRDRGRIRMHFTQRTQEDEIAPCVAALESMIATVRGFSTPSRDSTRLAVTLPSDINLIAGDALVRYDESVGQQALPGIAERIGDEIRTEIRRPACTQWAAAAIARWGALLGDGEPLVHVIVDRAGLPRAFGGVAFDRRAVSAAFMTNDQDSLRALPAVKVNLETTGPLVFRATLAHEIAHVLGSNPAGCRDNGHLAAKTDYKSAEGAYGPKMLFDAYFFEALVEYHAGVVTPRMRAHAGG